MKILYLKTPPEFSITDKLAFEILKSQMSGSLITGVILTQEELEDAIESANAEALTDEDLTALKSGNNFLGVPIHVTDSDNTDDRFEVAGYTASCNASVKRLMN